jgi:hypothetical protein
MYMMRFVLLFLSAVDTPACGEASHVVHPLQVTIVQRRSSILLLSLSPTRSTLSLSLCPFSRERDARASVG